MKVVVVSYGSRGDVEPCAALGRELLHRGHQVQMTVPPNLLKFVESAGLTAVAYGPDSREQLNPASELVRDLATKPQNWFDLLGHVIQHVSAVDAEKSATLTSLADGADLLVSGFNEQGLTANVAEYYGIPFAALHYFPERLWASGGPRRSSPSTPKTRNAVPWDYRKRRKARRNGWPKAGSWKSKPMTRSAYLDGPPNGYRQKRDAPSSAR